MGQQKQHILPKIISAYTDNENDNYNYNRKLTDCSHSILLQCTPTAHTHNKGKTTQTMSERGEEVRFVRGTYSGKKGWIDSSREPTAESVPVIVHKVKTRSGKIVDKATTVRKASIKYAKVEVTSFADAILNQQPKIDHLMEKLCEKLVMCNIDPHDQDIVNLFSMRLVSAVMKQEEKGDNAL